MQALSGPLLRQEGFARPRRVDAADRNGAVETADRRAVAVEQVAGFRACRTMGDRDDLGVGRDRRVDCHLPVGYKLGDEFGLKAVVCGQTGAQAGGWFNKEINSTDDLNGLSMRIERGRTVALVGESGSGKSVTALSVMQLLPYPVAWHGGGSIRFRDTELMGAPASRMREVRGNRIAKNLSRHIGDLFIIEHSAKQQDRSFTRARPKNNTGHKAHLTHSSPPPER